MPISLLTRPREVVKDHLVRNFSSLVDSAFAQVDAGASPRDLEEGLWPGWLGLGQSVLAAGFAALCERETQRDIQARGLAPEDVRIRADDGYWITQTTTFGRVSFPAFAYRDVSSGVAEVTRTPARDTIFELQEYAKSSELCIEWEARLGSEQPFRRAEEALTYFTHGAVRVEDTTIAEHMVVAGQMIDHDWTYRSVAEIRKILRDRAACDLVTGRPIIYLSTDGHMLRRYVDATWKALWKQANGLRLWCVDRQTGAIIHLGGEYTWGDCQRVEEIAKWLQTSGRLPVDGNYGDGLVATISIPTDGAPWIKERLLPLYPGAVPFLDPYHVFEHLGDFAQLRFPKNPKRRRAWYNRAAHTLLDRTRSRRGRAKLRKGHRKRRRTDPRPPGRTLDATLRTAQSAPHSGEALLELLRSETVPEDLQEDHEALLTFVENNCFRMDYQRYRARGFQIGSGAMESLHRNGSQLRLKLPGMRCLPETAQSIFNLRMLQLVGRWDEFRHQPDMTTNLVKAFATRAAGTQDAVVLCDAAAG